MKKIGTMLIVMLLAMPYGLYGKKGYYFNFTNKTNKDLDLRVVESGRSVRCKPHKFRLKAKATKKLLTNCCINKVFVNNEMLWTGGAFTNCGADASIVEKKDGKLKLLGIAKK